MTTKNINAAFSAIERAIESVTDTDGIACGVRMNTDHIDLIAIYDVTKDEDPFVNLYDHLDETDDDFDAVFSLDWYRTDSHICINGRKMLVSTITSETIAHQAA